MCVPEVSVLSERPEFCTAATGRIVDEERRCGNDEFGVHRCIDTFEENPHALHTCSCEFQWISSTMAEEIDRLNALRR